MGKVPKPDKKAKKDPKRKIRENMEQGKVDSPKKNNSKNDKPLGGKKNAKPNKDTGKQSGGQGIGNNQKTQNTNGQSKYQNANVYKKQNQAKMDFIKEPLKSGVSSVKRPTQKPQNVNRPSGTREPVQSTQTTLKSKTPIDDSIPTTTAAPVRTPDARKYHEIERTSQNFQTTAGTTFAPISTTTGYIDSSTHFPEPFFQSSHAIYGAVLILALGMCCLWCPFYFYRRFLGVFRRKKSRGREVPHSRLGTNEFNPTDVPTTISRIPGEAHRLLNNERSRQEAFEDEMDRIMKSLEVGAAYGSTGVNKSDSKVEEDTLLSNYEDSLKLSEKEKTELNEMDEQIKSMRDEAKRIKEATVKIKQRSNNSSVVGSFSDLDAQDAAFRKELEEQNRKFEEVMRKLREQRREKERLAQEEFEQIRLETARNIAAFLACIQLKLRFEDEEQKWGDQLTNLRKPLITVTTSYYNLQDELRSVDYTDDFSTSCVDSEGNLFAKKVVDAQKMLSIAFDNLESLTENYDDRIFIKIIMKSISEQGHICNEIGEELVKALIEKANHRKLDDIVQKLNPHAIPTTGALKRMSVVARDLDYLDIPCVPGPQWLRFFK